MNPILCTDSYKITQWPQYPPQTEYVHSYLEARYGPPGMTHTTFFGEQYVRKTFLNRWITRDDLAEAEELTRLHFRKPLLNVAGFQRILNVHDGYWPVRVRAVPEGTNVPISNVMLTMENTDPELPWVTDFLETKIVQLWYPITVATVSQHCRRVILSYLRKTGTPEDIDYKLHDFGFRGVSTEESAVIGGMAHLVNFMGTDTLPSLVGARTYYGCQMAGHSVPASQHSTIAAWGRSREADAYQNMLTVFPESVVACVSDTYDIYHACEALWGTLLREQVLRRHGTLVIRPDSGPPVATVIKCLDILWGRFGGIVNHKGYRVLDPHVRLIQGDGVDPEMIEQILKALEVQRYSADNLSGFGMGRALLQAVDRDMFSIAMKCSAVTVNGADRLVSKDPVGDHGKRSKPGRLTLYRRPDGLLVTSTLSSEGGKAPNWTDAMRITYEHNRDGHYEVEPETLDTIRGRSREGE